MTSPLSSDSTTVIDRVRGGRDGDKPTYLTTEFLVLAVLTVGILLTAVIIQDTDDHEDYFRADRAWWYVVLLAVAYIISRGLAKHGRSGNRGY